MIIVRILLMELRAVLVGVTPNTSFSISMAPVATFKEEIVWYPDVSVGSQERIT